MFASRLSAFYNIICYTIVYYTFSVQLQSQTVLSYPVIAVVYHSNITNVNYQRPSEVLRMYANHVAAGALVRLRWGSSQPFPDHLTGGEESGCPLLKNSLSRALWASMFGPSGFSVPHPHSFLTPSSFIFFRNMPGTEGGCVTSQTGLWRSCTAAVYKVADLSKLSADVEKECWRVTPAALPM